MSTKENKKVNENNEEVADARAGAVTVAEPTAVSTQTSVAGVTLHFPFIRKGEQMSQWKCDGRGPEQGCLYIGKNKELNVKIAEAGRNGGFNAIILGADFGYVQEKQFDGTAPQRFFGADALEQAKKAGFDPAKRIPTGRVASDGYVYTVPQLSQFCLLKVLVPVDDTFTSMEFQMFPIGDRLYTPGRIEYGRKNFSALNDVLTNIRNVSLFRWRNAQKKAGTYKGDEDFTFDLTGKVGRVFTCEEKSKQTNNTYYTLGFELASRDGKPWEFTTDESEDFTRFLMSVKETVVDINDVGSDELDK